jgi:hypothetical protein
MGPLRGLNGAPRSASMGPLGGLHKKEKVKLNLARDTEVGPYLVSRTARKSAQLGALTGPLRVSIGSPRGLFKNIRQGFCNLWEA